MDDPCGRCAAIDWVKLIHRAHNAPSGDRLLELQVASFRLTCAVCVMFAAIADEQYEQRHRPVSITLSPRRGGLISKEKGEPATLTLSFDGILYQNDPFVAPRTFVWTYGSPSGLSGLDHAELYVHVEALEKIDIANADLNLLRSWIRGCQNNHGEACKITKHKAIPSLHVIDVHTGFLERAEHSCEYTALSYVWGDSNPPEEAFDPGLTSVLKNAPETIRDAARLARELGYRYIWIDRYCIPQDDPRAKHDQIQRMDLVYAQAELTIVAAAGDGPDFGLPGIGSRPRDAQERALDWNLPQCDAMDPNDIYRPWFRSPWKTRGWTYQEDVCSRRRVFCTSGEMVFQCRSMLSRETGRRPQRLGVMAEAAQDLRGNIWGHIREYSTRHLSFDSDALDGLLGIFHRYQGGPTPVYHLWGIPFSGGPDSRPSAEERFLAGLCWTTKNARRRAAFPSWSWTGWHAGVSTRFTGARERVPLSTDLVLRGTVSVECDDASVRSFDDFCRERAVRGALDGITKFLLVECWTVELQVKLPPPRPADWSEGESWAWPAGKYGPGEGAKVVLPMVLLDEPVARARSFGATPNAKWLGLLFEDMAYRDDASAGRRSGTRAPGLHNGIIVVVRERADCYERVGFIVLRERDLVWFPAPPSEDAPRPARPRCWEDTLFASDYDADSEVSEGRLAMGDWLPEEFTWKNIRLG